MLRDNHSTSVTTAACLAQPQTRELSSGLVREEFRELRRQLRVRAIAWVDMVEVVAELSQELLRDRTRLEDPTLELSQVPSAVVKAVSVAQTPVLQLAQVVKAVSEAQTPELKLVRAVSAQDRERQQMPARSAEANSGSSGEHSELIL